MLTGIAPDGHLEMQMDALRPVPAGRGGACARGSGGSRRQRAPLMKVSDFLTWTAEQVIQKALEIAWKQLAKRHGRPQCIEHGRLRDARFAIIAYGKLGGWELGYGSDLDLVFLHDSRSAEQQTNGPKVLDNIEFFTRLAQRVINILSIPTTSGVLYQVDTRLQALRRRGAHREFPGWLRPVPGTAGLDLGSTQALLRARPVAGNPEVAEAFVQQGAPHGAVAGAGSEAKLRQRRIATHARAHAPGAGPSRHGLRSQAGCPGGLTDMEFLGAVLGTCVCP